MNQRRKWWFTASLIIFVGTALYFVLPSILVAKIANTHVKWVYWTKYVIGFAMLFAAVFIWYVLSLHLILDPYFSRQHSRKVLAKVSTTEQLQTAVGSLGIFLAFPDRSWIAIRYRDSHAGGIWSVAVARDSGGHWYQSHDHFCGAFSSVKFEASLPPKLRENSSPSSIPSDPTDHEQWIRFLAGSPDLATARQRLLSRYFTKSE